jgi:hypothetical protein
MTGEMGTTMVTQLSRQACEDRDLVLPYPDTGNRVGQNVFAVVFFSVLASGPLIGIYAWTHIPGCGPAACWPVLVWFGALGAGCILMLVGAIVRMVVTGRRRARGDGWLHLSSAGFEVHPRTGKLRRYEWRELDEFMLVESRDDENNVFTQVGFRYAPERRRTLRDKLRRVLAPPCSRDGMKADGVVDGHWDRPIDEAVGLMNEWLARDQRRLHGALRVRHTRYVGSPDVRLPVNL